MVVDRLLTYEFDVKKDMGFFKLYFEMDVDLIKYVKMIPSSKYNSKYRCWIVEANVINVKYVLLYCKKFEFSMDILAEKELSYLINRKTSKELKLLDFKMTLRDFQRDGVLYLINHERVLLADDMGCGKTIQSIAAVNELNAFPCIIVCPSLVKYNWQNELNACIDVRSIVIDGSKPLDDYTKYDVIIINYDILTKHLPNLLKINFKSIVADESHMIKNYKSLRTKNVKTLSKNIKYRFALTGTPILNRPQELISQLEYIGRLDYMGGFWGFAKTYCDATETAFGWDMKGSKNLPQLNTKLSEMCMIRRLKSDVLKELPDKQKVFIPITLSNNKEYKKIEKDFSKWMNDRIKENSKFEESMIPEGVVLNDNQKKILVEAYTKKKILRMKKAEAMIKIEHLKQLCVKGKLDSVCEFIDNFVESEQKLVVFCTHQSVQKQLYDRYKGINCTKIFSEDSALDRQKSVEVFQKDDKCYLMLLSLATGGVGITLTASSNVAFVEFGWTPSIMSQAEDRCYRMGQKNAVTCYYFYGKDTIDEYILDIINNKRKISDCAMDGIEIEDDEETKNLFDVMSRYIK